jgi:hypothetical protein
LFQSLADDQVKLAVGFRPFLFPQARLDDAAALARKPHRRFMRGPIS